MKKDLFDGVKKQKLKSYSFPVSIGLAYSMAEENESRFQMSIARLETRLANQLYTARLLKSNFLLNRHSKSLPACPDQSVTFKLYSHPDDMQQSHKF